MLEPKNLFLLYVVLTLAGVLLEYPFIDDRIVHAFVEGVSTCSTVDCYLTKLDTLIITVEEMFRDEVDRVLREILMCREVREVLSTLAGYVNEVKELALTDPRHTPVKRRLDVILEALKAIEPTVKPLGITRSPTFRIEHEERRRELSVQARYTQLHYVEEELPRTVIPVRRRRGYRSISILRIMHIAALVNAIISFALPWLTLELRLPWLVVYPHIQIYTLRVYVYGYQLLQSEMWSGVVIYILGVVVGIASLLLLGERVLTALLSGALLALGPIVAYANAASIFEEAVTQAEEFKALLEEPLANLIQEYGYKYNLRDFVALNPGGGIVLGIIAGVILVFIGLAYAKSRT